ncbi:type VI secretion system tube protein TssD [Chryseobacterium sp. ES2]|uniref:Type VI secretion system tube protein TssD n=2 Tax=Chryseobacterium TaxID=59732 RepID=A0ABU1E4D6_9FLAO|nr:MULTISPECIES: type VI secretion system tube protein TssD [Chryseobacterium]MDQ1855089.1 type VI secretion system tube protein TssD [Chryseobacterium sp. WLY505]MDR4952620.1 type VI secretion system tube protein TssD [Chryseobacterium sp. ES2]
MAERNSRGILKFNNGEGQKLLKLNYSVSRATDVSGRVASDPSNALIKITVEATDKSDILESLLNGKYKPTVGEITFNKSHEEGTLTTLKWNNGYVIQHEVDFDAVDENSMYISFVVSAEQIDLGNSSYFGAWPS